jgi:Signal transduction histidine kinase
MPNADTMVIDIKADGGYVVVTITNNDRSDRMSPRVDLGSGSCGFIGLRERVELLGGGMEAGPLPDGGWRLRLVIPFEAEDKL